MPYLLVDDYYDEYCDNNYVDDGHDHTTKTSLSELMRKLRESQT